MPHVVLNGDVNITDIFKTFKPVFIRNEQGILKTGTYYISYDKSAILIESLAIETGVKKSFLAMISRRDDGIVVRIFPGSEVEKTAGVKKILAEIAKQIKAAFPHLTIGETNLSEYLT